MFTAISSNSVTLSGTVAKLEKILKNLSVAKVLIVVQAVVVEMWYWVVLYRLVVVLPPIGTIPR